LLLRAFDAAAPSAGAIPVAFVPQSRRTFCLTGELGFFYQPFFFPSNPNSGLALEIGLASKQFRLMVRSPWPPTPAPDRTGPFFPLVVFLLS